MIRADALSAVVALLIPLGDSATAIAATASPAVAAAPAALVDRERAAFNAHDAIAVANFHAPHTVLKVLTADKTLASGRAAVAAYFTGVYKNFPNIHLTLDKQLTMNTMVVNEYTVAGTPGVKLIAIYDVHNDAIANEWLIFD